MKEIKKVIIEAVQDSIDLTDNQVSISVLNILLDQQLPEQLLLHNVSHSFTKEDMWDAWWASAIKTISFSGIDKDYERRCFEKFYKNKIDSNCG